MATTQRSVRIEQSLWQRFMFACAERGIDRSKRIVELIKRDVDEHEGSKKA